MLRQLLKGRFLGHPVHPMLVHFPTALFTVALLFDVAGAWASNPILYSASFYCTGVGLAGGLGAALFGLIDYIRLADNKSLFRKASRHALIQFLVLCLFGVAFGLRFGTENGMPESPFTVLGLEAFGVMLMLVGNYLGGDLVFRNGVGVQSE